MLHLQPIRHLKPLYRSIHTQSTTNVAILGAGIGGLSSAIYLLRSIKPQLRSTTKIVIFERQSRVGGWCRANRLINDEIIDDPNRHLPINGQDETLVFETGPRSIRPQGLSGWLFVELVHRLRLHDRIVTVSKSSSSAKNRYLYTNHLFPSQSSTSSNSSNLTILPNSISTLVRDLVSNRSLFRRILPEILLEPFRPRSLLHTSEPYGDESLSTFFTRRFGPHLSNELISAMIHGIYAGSSKTLSMRGVFPQLWEMEREFGSLLIGGLFGNWIRRWRKIVGKGGLEKSRFKELKRKEDLELEKIKERLKDESIVGRELVKDMERASVWGVRGGLEEITMRMKEYLVERGVEFRMGSEEGEVREVEQVDRREGEEEKPCWRIHTNSTTTPPFSASYLITTNPSLLPSHLSPPKFPSATVSVINLSYPLPSSSSSSNESSSLFPKGFGYLIPRTVPLSENPHHVLGVLFDSDVMPQVDNSSSSRNPPLVKVSILLGGSYYQDLPSIPQYSSKRLIEMSIETLRLHFPSIPPSILSNPLHSFVSTHVNCIPQIPPSHRSEILAFSKRLTNASKGGRRVGIVGGGFASVGVNGAVKQAWEIGTAFGEDINVHNTDMVENGGEEMEEKEKKVEKKVERKVRKAVRNGMEMWQL